jgi:hypothetical protein
MSQELLRPNTTVRIVRPWLRANTPLSPATQAFASEWISNNGEESHQVQHAGSNTRGEKGMRQETATVGTRVCAGHAHVAWLQEAHNILALNPKLKTLNSQHLGPNPKP